MPSRAAARERYSFASLEEILEMPDLLAVQKDSFEWFMRHGLQDVFSDSHLGQNSPRLNVVSSITPTRCRAS